MKREAFGHASRDDYTTRLDALRKRGRLVAFSAVFLGSGLAFLIVFESRLLPPERMAAFPVFAVLLHSAMALMGTALIALFPVAIWTRVQRGSLVREFETEQAALKSFRNMKG